MLPGFSSTALSITGITVVLWGLYAAYNYLASAIDRAIENHAELVDALEKTTEEAEALDEKLLTYKDRLKELESIDAPTLVEKEEISKLETTIPLLEKQLEIKRKLADFQEREAADAAAKALTTQSLYLTGNMIITDYGIEIPEFGYRSIIDEISQYQKDLESVTKSISQAYNDLAQLEPGTAAYERQEAQISALEARKTSLNKSVTELQSDILALYNSLLDYDGNVIVGYEDIADIAKAVLKLDDNIESLGDTAEKSAKKIESVMSDVEHTIKSSKKALSELETLLEGDDHDSGYEARVKYLKQLKEVLKSGEVGSKEYAALTDYFGIGDMSVDEVTAWTKTYDDWFTEGTTGVDKFLSKVKELSKEGGELEGIMSYDGSAFYYDVTQLDEAAEALGVHKDVLIDMIQKVRMYSADWELTVESMFDALSMDNVVREVDTGVFVAQLKDIQEYLGMSAEEAQEFIDNYNALGSGELKLVDDSALRNWAGFADYTKRSTEEINALTDALVSAGMSYEDAMRYSSDDWWDIDADFGSILEPFLKDLGWAQEEIDTLYEKITNTPQVSGVTEDVDKEVTVGVAMVINDEEVQAVIKTTEEDLERVFGKTWQTTLSCDGKPAQNSIANFETLLIELPQDTPITLLDNTQSAQDGLSTVADFLDHIELNKTKTITIGWKYKNGNIGGFAQGTTKSPKGPALLGDEYSPDGSPKPELVVSDGEAYVAGLNGPEIRYLNEGDQVYTADQTRKDI